MHCIVGVLAVSSHFDPERIGTLGYEQIAEHCHVRHLYVLSNGNVQVEVCCLEDVMRAMKEDRTGVWDDAFFVMSGGLKGQVGPEKDQKPS